MGVLLVRFWYGLGAKLVELVVPVCGARELFRRFGIYVIYSYQVGCVPISDLVNCAGVLQERCLVVTLDR